jgi:putative membrane protein
VPGRNFNFGIFLFGKQIKRFEIENDNDGMFLMKAAEIQMEEISLGKLAQQKGTSDHVKALGKMMETDHTKTLEELRTLAQSKSIAIPTVASDNSRNSYEKLNEKTGNDFGKEYSDMMVKHHEDAIKLFEKAAADSKDAEIRSWASGKLAGLNAHLGHAKECKKKCDAMKS